ncbi:hypothetical protein ACLB2K_069770 [Fragaria x ananassa]
MDPREANRAAHHAALLAKSKMGLCRWAEMPPSSLAVESKRGHPLYMDANEPDAFNNKKQAMEAVDGRPISRTPNLAVSPPVLDQNLYYMGMKHSSATFTSAMCNMLPAFAFCLAWIFRFEKVSLKKLRSVAKVMETIITVGEAIILTLVKGRSPFVSTLGQ